MHEEFVFGYDIQGTLIWVMYKFNEQWWSTDRQTLMRINLSREYGILHYLQEYPDTDKIEYRKPSINTQPPIVGTIYPRECVPLQVAQYVDKRIEENR